MGQQERSAAKRRRKANLRKVLLQTVQAAGLLSVALVAPNVLGAMGKLGMLPGPRQKESIRAARTRMIRQGLLCLEKGSIRLSRKGEKLLMSIELKEFSIPHPRKWDELWRVLIFDIPEPRKSVREKIRYMLASAGFVRLQDSVWVYPYNCEDFVSLLKADLRVGHDMQYLIVQSIENDAHLKNRFNL